jgi:sugar phosphate isomerase/epimerase
MNTSTRRDFLATSAAFAVALGGAGVGGAVAAQEKPADRAAAKAGGGAGPFKISLAEWSFHRAILREKTLDHLDFAKTAKEFGIDAVEYVNQMFKDKANDEKYIAEMKKRCDDLGVRSMLIMCDGEGNLGDADDAKRTKAVENHHKWADAAKFLGCHSIRVNAASSGPYEEQIKLAADGLRKLTEYCAGLGLNCIVENHGGLSSNGKWLAQVMKTVGHPRCGTLPDFGNFRISDKEEYDRYKGVTEMMPFAKAVSAKTHDFDEQGNETHTDYFKMMKIVVEDFGYSGHVGIEYEGSKLGEREGIAATKKLLERVKEKMA